MSMTNDQLSALAERLVSSFEKMASALEGLDETYRQHFDRQYPKVREVRQAVVTRVPSQEDLIKEAQQGTGDWFSEEGEWAASPEEDEDLGVREREWLETHPKGHARPSGQRAGKA